MKTRPEILREGINKMRKMITKPKLLTEAVNEYSKKITVEKMLQANIAAFKSWCSDKDINYKKISKEQILNIVLITLKISAESEALAEALDADFFEGDGENGLMEYLKGLGAYIDEDDNDDYLDER